MPLRLRLPLSLGLLVLCLSAPALHAQTRYTWAVNNGDWSDPDNWSPNGVPAATDTAVVENKNIVLDVDATVAKLVFDINVNFQLTGSGGLTVTDSLRWEQGKFAGSGTVRVAPGAVLLITGPGGLYQVSEDRVFVNEGEGLWETPVDLSFGLNGEFFNEGTLDLAFESTGGSFCGGTGADQFVNAPGGLIRRTGPGEAGVACGFVNDGTVRIEQGGIGLNRAGTDEGDWEVWAGATLRTINNLQTIAASGSITGAGTVHLDGGRLDVDGEATIDTLLMETDLGGDGTLTVAGTLDWNTGAMRDGGTTVLASGTTATIDFGTISISDARTLRNEGTLTWSGEPDLNVTTDALLLNVGTMTSTGAGNRTLGGGGTLRNEGLFVHDADTLQVSSTTLDNASTVRLDGGVFQINSNGTFAGRYEIAPEATLSTINGAITFPDAATLVGTGTVDLTGGTVTNAATWQPGPLAGSAPGVLAVDSFWPAMQPAGVLEVELGGTTPGTEFDQLAVAGEAALGGTLRVVLTGGFVPEDGDRFLVVPAEGGATGAFDALDLPDGLEAFVEATADGAELVIGAKVSSEPGADLPEAFALDAPYPNPARGAVTVAFELPEAADVRLAVYDVLGRRVASLVEGRREAGWHEAALPAAPLAAGVYVVRFEAGATVQTRRLTVAR